MRRGKQWAWWNLPAGLKAILQRERLAGRYGGESAVGIGHAPYFWAQEYGEPAAEIKAQHFARDSWAAFENDKANIFRQAVRESLIP